MPPHLESDSYDNITEGKYVYWMRQDEDIPRGHLGRVVVVKDDEKRKVQFPNGTWTVKVKGLNVSEFQEGGYVHIANGDYSSDVIGEIKDLENGKLLVEVDGKQQYFDPSTLIRCDFQPGMLVFWTKSDDDIPAGHMGTVRNDLKKKGRVQVKFPNGAWNFKPEQLVRAPFQLHTLVQWKRHDDDVEQGEVGQVIAGPNDDGRIKVQFVKGAWRFPTKDLFPIEMQLGSFVTWQKHDEDIPKGDVGEVVKVKVETGRLVVQFPKGRWGLKVKEIRMYSLQPGEFVHWKRCDEDIDRGDIGEIVRIAEGKSKFRVQWPKGVWTMSPKELEKLSFQRDDRVQLKEASDDVPQGQIGQIMGVQYNGDGAGKKLFARFANGCCAFSPEKLKYINLDNDSVNELKATFKRFDKNGDGKLSLEELSSVLKNLNGDGSGLSDDECGELFSALDKDGNGKLTADEFIDYVFGTEVSGSNQKLLGDGFGLPGVLGVADDDNIADESDDDDPNSGGGGGTQDVVQQNFSVTYDEEDKEDIDGETMVTKAEWASAMLSVGVCRAAAVESFEGALADLGEGEEVAVKYLAMELNGMGKAGIEELRGAVGRVKKGKVPVVDLETPSEESDFEVELARKTGLDGLLRHLQVKNKSPQDAVSELAEAKLSALETKVLGGLGDDLPMFTARAASYPDTLSAVSSWQRAREHCRKEVQEIIERCQGSGEKFVDTTFDPNADENFVMYVDKEKPGYDCTASKPRKGWMRAKEVWAEGQLTIDGAGGNDVDQGKCGDCYMLGALAAVAANRKRFVRQVFVHYDMDVGVYGLLFNVEGNFTYVIIDDYLGMLHSNRVMYAKSMQDNEMWVALIEKAFFKHHTCIEMCDGGRGTEAMFCWLGGVTGRYSISSDYFDKPKEFFKLIDKALADGELMCTGWTQPSKGKYAQMEGGEGGECGETGLPCGLIGGHCYSLIRTAEVDGKQLVCCRNPWGSGEWTGPYSDKSDEMTDELKEALNHEGKVDGTFWMAIEDFVQLSSRCSFLRHFGPTWQCAVGRGVFSNEETKGRAKKDYNAQDDDEISFQKGDMIQVTQNQGYWSKGINKDGDEGYFRTSYIDIQMKDVYKLQLGVEDIQKGEPLIFALMVENQLMRREFTMRKVDGLNYKDKKQPSGCIYTIDANGKKKTHKLRYRHFWTFCEPDRAPWTIYMAITNGKGMRYNAYGYARHGTVKLKAEKIGYSELLDAI